MNFEHSETIQRACQFIAEANIESAAEVIEAEYPFAPVQKSGRSYTPRQMTRIFIRDGFIDRYRGTRLIYPPVLRLLSHYLPTAFPYHKNSKMTEGHMAYWELLPTIDHVDPVAKGGPDSEENWVCCSMLTNSIKSNWTLAQLQWELLPKGDMAQWDGMMSWFIEQASRDHSVFENSYIKRWHSAAISCMNLGT